MKRSETYGHRPQPDKLCNQAARQCSGPAEDTVEVIEVARPLAGTLTQGPPAQKQVWRRASGLGEFI